MRDNALICAFICATTASSLFAHLWPFGGMEGLPGPYVLFTWVYCLICFLVQDICKVTLNLAMDALEFGAETTAKNDPERDAKRLARVRLAEDKHQRSGTVSSPQTGPSNGLSSAGMSTLGLGSAAITSKEDIVRRMDSLAQELEVGFFSFGLNVLPIILFDCIQT